MRSTGRCGVVRRWLAGSWHSAAAAAVTARTPATVRHRGRRRRRRRDRHRRRAARREPSPEGEPIRFVVATAVSGVVAQPEIFDAADAAVAAINADGGIPDPAGGPARPLEVVRCEAGAGGNDDPDAALNCAQDTIDQGVIAVVGRYLFGADATQAWAEAGIPMIGSSPDRGRGLHQRAGLPDQRRRPRRRARRRHRPPAGRRGDDRPHHRRRRGRPPAPRADHARRWRARTTSSRRSTSPSIRRPTTRRSSPSS